MKRVLWGNWAGRKVSVGIGFNARDLWMGVYVKPERDRLTLYWCPLPTLVVRITLPRRKVGAR